MTVEHSTTPIALLQELELRAKAHASPLPQKVDIKKTWQGLGFQIGSVNLIAPLDQVGEILTEVQLTEIPGVKSWVKGVANVRGNLLPVIDLLGLIGGVTSIMSSKSRIIVAHHLGMDVGLVVDEVLGLKNFFVEDFSNKHVIKNDQIAQFVNGSYQQQSEQWPVFDFKAVMKDPGFRLVAA